tara:strand:- start:2266 stop:2580 length:315 start_codon:yes stop_codon:yes gene_type:complete
MGTVEIKEKPVIKPRRPYEMESLTAYEVVSAEEDYKHAEVGDIVLLFPGASNGQFIFNATKQAVCWDRTWSDGKFSTTNATFLCERAYHIESVTFHHDSTDRPS